MYVNHTADDLNKTVHDILTKRKLHPSEMSAITTDNASNNVKAFKCYT